MWRGALAPRRLAPLAALALAAGCAGASARPVVAAADAPAWPAAPDKPRARWLAEFPPPGQAVERTSWLQRAWETLIGASAGAREERALLTRPFGVAVEGEALLVADPEGHRVLRVDWKGGRSEPVTCAARAWQAPSAVAVDADGTRFVADSGAAVVVRVPRQGPCVALGEGRLERPTGVALSASHLFVTDPPRHQVVVLAADGSEAARLGGRGDEAGQLNFPSAIAAAPDGSLLVVDALNFRVARFAPTGAWLGSFGGPGDRLGGFIRPKGIAAGDDGRVYVSDAETDLVTVFTAEGTPLYALGRPGAGPGELQMPAGLAVQRDRLFVADALNGRVQIYELLGDPS
jgi:DNA-binding beta-propeller fold protein YncE